MKLILIWAITLTAFGQEAKVVPPKATAPPVIASERLFPADEVEKLTLASAQIEVLRARFKVEELEAKYKEFQAAVAPIAAKQEAILKSACTIVGVSEENMKAGRCGISLGVDAMGNPVNGPDGKQLASKVWAKPAETALNLPVVEKK